MRPFVVLNCAMTLDGFLDVFRPEASGEPLRISNAADLDRVDALRATCDAILVGADTVRRDDPRLTVKSDERVAARRAAGKSEQPQKVTLSRGGAIEPSGPFFAGGPQRTFVYVSADASAAGVERLAAAATVTRCPGTSVSLPHLLDDLARRGVKRLLVEGGSSILTAFLVERLVDEMSVAIGPFLVGDERAPRFVRPARFPFDKGHPLRLKHVERLDDVAVLHYAVDPSGGGSRGHG